MMKKAFLTVALCSALAAFGQTDLFQPYRPTDLRLPSVPLVVNDPYFSIWSPFDKLTDGSTRHWTDVKKPLEGLLRVDGTAYRFLGENNARLQSISPMADEERWEGCYTHEVQRDGWANPQFDDSQWKTGRAAWGSPDLSFISTPWSDTNSDLYVRRVVKLSKADLNEDLWLQYSHDDVFELYLNGKKILDTGEIWREGVLQHLDNKLKALLHEGENVIAAHCHNTTGGAYTDFGLFKNLVADNGSIKTAKQKSISVLATNTYYTFECGPVLLDVVFTAPMLIDDYDLLSTPVNYISYQVRSTDKREHDVQLLLTASPELAQNKATQAMLSEVIEKGGVTYVRTGTVNQPILAQKGDLISIDWGHLYLPAINGDVSLTAEAELKQTFLAEGRLPRGERRIQSHNLADMPTLAYCHDFGRVSQASSYMLLGYDEDQDIEYMYRRYKAYWAHEGRVNIFQAFRNLNAQYSDIMQRCRDFDKRIYDDGLRSGNKHYAEMLSGAYRHVMAAHKLFKDQDGNLLWFSKENNSNGCVNTVDLTYPEAPLFLAYNPELQKAMMTSIFDYSLSGRWTKPFAAHDLGTYPIANGQVYGGDMPLEESGNMLTLAAMLCKLDGNTNYVDKYWQLMTTWVDYLVENGQDPANQLCTDDFAGHWAHNANLSVKAIMGVAAYAEMARMRGDKTTADKYLETARRMAAKWESDAREGDHYRLAFDRQDTWSQKYNMVWDKLWGLNLFPNGAMQREVSYYLKQQNRYGLPLDCRRTYTKSDWIMWTAAMSPDTKTFLKFMEPVYTYINETSSRVPTSDWHETTDGRMVGFRARSVIGGYWMKVFADKIAR